MMLKNAKKDEDVTLVNSLTKTISGAFVNELSVASHELPGNFGVRCIETMPTNLRDVFINQLNNLDMDYKCDYRHMEIPELLAAPDTNDYFTDEESDDAPDFDVKVPELETLLEEFESGDPEITAFNEGLKSLEKDLEQRGFEPEARHDITSKQQTQVKMLNTNITN